MKLKSLFMLVLLAVCLLPVRAQDDPFDREKSNEGMWLPLKVAELNIEDMKAMGLELEAEEVYNEEGPSLEDAVVKLNGGSCTSEMISPKGLMLTNHHCAYDAIAALSSVENDYLTDGFWAGSMEEELPIEGATASLLVHSEDVTEKIIAEGGDNPMMLEEAKAKLISDATEGTEYTAEVKEMFHGSEFYLFVYQTFRDVRLVGAPPSSIGKFGGDTDNWMWPRHTGDFSLLRVYANSDNQPADYSEDNQPYEPKHFFPISLSGVKEGDYAMVMGYPGSTSRYLTAAAIDNTLEVSNPVMITVLGIKLEEMKKAMDADDKVRIAMASEYASLANYYKYLIGQTTMMKRYNVVDRRKETEKEFQEWVEADSAREAKYGTVLADIAELFESYESVEPSVTYTFWSLQAATTTELGTSMLALKRALDNVGEDRDQMVREVADEILADLDALYEHYDSELDKAVFLRTAMAHYQNTPEELHPEIFKEMTSPLPEEKPEEMEAEDKGKKKKKKRKKKKKKKKKTQEVEPVKVMAPMLSDEEYMALWADMAYETSILRDKESLRSFLEDPQPGVLPNDPFYRYSESLINTFRSELAMSYGGFNNRIDFQRKKYLEAMREMHPEKDFYPDANSTMRVTYGKVKPYEPRDGVEYFATTTLAGVMEKEDPTSEEFIVPAKLKELYEAQDYGRYAEDGTLYVNFLTTNDITGGNSGSPVLNSKGQLIGCAFDGNWESMSSDIIVFPWLNRTICVDARYILFVIDKFADADWLLDEIEIVE